MNRLRPVIAALAVSACTFHGAATGPSAHDHHTVAPDKATLSHLTLTMGAGELEVAGGAHAFLDGDFTYNVPAWKPVVTDTTAGTERTVEVAQESTTGASGHSENHWTLAVNDEAPVDVTAHLGAGQARLKLGSLNLRGLNLTIGAGEVDVDLRGTPSASYHVSLHGGVGRATVHLPASVAISASASGGIGDINVTGLEQRDGRWVNPRAPAGAPVTITLDAQGGVGEIQIIAE
jgi:hypothetical protein